MNQSDVLLLEPSAPDDLFQSGDQALWRGKIVVALLLITLVGLSLLAHYLTPVDWNIAATRTLQSQSLPGLHELMRLVSGFGNAPKIIAITVIVLFACNKAGEAFWLTFSGLG